ncbi:MAG: PPC domain-containing protein [Anaerolineae bacterium]|nr:PPC domain-containing protein [Anaerolineae bacterium]
MFGSIRVRIHYDRISRLVLLLVAALLVTVFLGYLIWGQVVAASAANRAEPRAADATYVLQPAAAQSWRAPAPRSYYLSRTDYNGAAADTACEPGYHMAALWEIADLSNLRYTNTFGDSRADSGYGPPSFMLGWVRTGSNNSVAAQAGVANCNGWTSSSASDNGSVVNLPADWTSASQDIGVWDVGYAGCSDLLPVWCVADAVGSGYCQEPLHISCGDRISGDTGNYASYIDTYTCSAWDESGAETMYAFTLADGDYYTVTASFTNLGADLDLFILSPTGCSAGTCYSADSYGDGGVTLSSVPSGTYYLAVDGYQGVYGTYTLELTCERSTERVYAPLVLRDY